MPLFMDLHKASDYHAKPTVEEIKKNHIADLEVQHKYGVRFLQYWINEEAGLVFCLMEAPNKESCAAVHREAHGAMPCNVIELQGGDYRSYMGDESRANKFDIAEWSNGTLDTGYRLIMVVDLIFISADESPRTSIKEIAAKFGGRWFNKPGRRLSIAFSSGHRVAECCKEVIEYVKKYDGMKNEVRIGVAAGEPVTMQPDIFGDVTRLAGNVCDFAKDGHVLVSCSVADHGFDLNLSSVNQLPIKIVDKSTEAFIYLFQQKVFPLLANGSVGIDQLTQELGMSRSQLYRKITELTGNSVNNFIQDFRMQQAMRLIRACHGNITQIAMEVGYNNPSYFAKNFQKRFGSLPLKIAKLIAK